MEKISGIIPQTPRTANRRVVDDRPIRPGAPAFGQPQGSSDIKDRVSITNARSVEIKPYVNPRDAAHVKIVENLSRNFFLTPQKQAAKKAALNEVEGPTLPDFEPSLDPRTSDAVDISYDDQE